MPKVDTAFNEELIVAENYAGGEIHAWRAVLRPRPFGGTCDRTVDAGRSVQAPCDLIEAAVELAQFFIKM